MRSKLTAGLVGLLSGITLTAWIVGRSNRRYRTLANPELLSLTEMRCEYARLENLRQHRELTYTETARQEDVRIAIRGRYRALHLISPV